MRSGLIIPILATFFIISCDKGNEQDKTIHVHKPKQDYSIYVPVELSSDKSTILSAPGRCEPPLSLVEGFFLGNTMGVNTAYLSLSIEEYNSHDPLLGVDSLYQYIMETDPFLEYYICEECNLFSEDGVDTAFINNLIREDVLTEYFTQLK